MWPRGWVIFHDRGTRRGWVVSSTPRPHFTLGKYPVPILQEAGWAPGPVWTGGKSRPHRDSIPSRSARSQSLYRLSYRAHIHVTFINENIHAARKYTDFWSRSSQRKQEGQCTSMYYKVILRRVRVTTVHILSLCVLVTLVIQYTKRVRHILLSLWPVWVYQIFQHYLKNLTIFENSYWT